MSIADRRFGPPAPPGPIDRIGPLAGGSTRQFIPWYSGATSALIRRAVSPATRRAAFHQGRSVLIRRVP